MSDDKNALQGLNCPRCGGMITIPEGQAVVICPFCELRSVVSGERGVRRYQVTQRIGREEALKALQAFLRGNMAIAGSAAREAKVSEVLLVHLPFWSLWGRALGWVFGEKRVGSGDNVRYEPREVRISEDMNWNGAACDVGEFGVTALSLQGRSLQAFQPDVLHASGMVFEPVGSSEEAHRTARQSFEKMVQEKAALERISQSIVRIGRPRLGLVYYPLWVLRYLYRGRAFQVVVDGFSGEVLYGKAPGNILYRAAALVGGMGVGAFTAIDIPYLLLQFSSDSEDSPFGFALAAFAIGLGIMYWGWRTFRHAEHYEFRRYGAPTGESFSKTARQALSLVEKLR